jgi:hypothetical protein
LIPEICCHFMKRSGIRDSERLRVWKILYKLFLHFFSIYLMSDIHRVSRKYEFRGNSWREICIPHKSINKFLPLFYTNSDRFLWIAAFEIKTYCCLGEFEYRLKTCRKRWEPKLIFPIVSAFRDRFRWHLAHRTCS